MPYYTLDDNIPDETGTPQIILQINQTGTNDPTYTIIKNTTPTTITSLTRDGIGDYTLTLADNILNANTSILLNEVNNNANLGFVTAKKGTGPTIKIRTTNLAATISDSIMVDTYLQITQPN